MSFERAWNEVLGHVPRVDPLLAQRLVNRAWEDIRNTRLWSWRRGVGVLMAPQIISGGTVTTTQFSAAVILDATANAALNLLNNPVITLRQIRVAQGPLYNIQAYDNATNTITLDRPFMETGGASKPYSVYRAYYGPADQAGNYTQDFETFRAILNPIEGYAIVGANLRLTRMELDARDPTRGAFDLAYTVAGYSVDSNGLPIYELWPHPTSQRAYITLYIKAGTDLSAAVALPSTISWNMLTEHALEFAYDWAIANAGRFPELKGVNWTLLKAETMRKYTKMMMDARRKDDDLITDTWIPRLRDYLHFPPIDARFWQSHDVSGWFDG